jgi:hypothetical protein
MATPRLLNIDAKKWWVDRRLDSSIHRRWHLAVNLEMGGLGGWGGT